MHILLEATQGEIPAEYPRFLSGAQYKGEFSVMRAV
jgi:hypothetical protein